MTRKRTLILGAIIIGLVIGVLMFVAAISLPRSSVFSTAFGFVHWPVGALIRWMDPASHGWGRNAGRYILLAALLCYWVVLGCIAVLGYWTFWGRKRADQGG
jgi:hypothetical protein